MIRTATSAPTGPTSCRAMSQISAKAATMRRLRQRVKEQIGPEQPVGRLQHPPWQRRQLVVAQLPFAAVKQAFDHIERQIEEKHRRQHGPDHGMERQERQECSRRMLMDGVGDLGHGPAIDGGTVRS